MVYAKDTSAEIEKRSEESKVAAIAGATKTGYQKNKERKRYEKGHPENRNMTGNKNWTKSPLGQKPL